MAYNINNNQIEAYALGKIKGDIIQMLQSDVDIVSLIIGESKPTYDLKYNNVFDSLVIDLTQTEVKTYVTMDALYISEGATIKCIELTMDIFTQLQSQKLTTSEQKKYYTTGYYGNRIDVLLDKILRLLNGSDKFGIGKMTLRPRNPMGYIQPSEKHYGKRVFFNVYDFA